MTVFEKEKLQDSEIFPEGLLERIYTLFPELVEAKIAQFSKDTEDWYHIGLLFEDGRFFHISRLKTGYPQYPHPLEIFTLFWNGEDTYKNCDNWVTSVYAFPHIGSVKYSGMKRITVKEGTYEEYGMP